MCGPDSEENDQPGSTFTARQSPHLPGRAGPKAPGVRGEKSPVLRASAGAARRLGRRGPQPRRGAAPGRLGGGSVNAVMNGTQAPHSGAGTPQQRRGEPSQRGGGAKGTP